MAKVEFKAKKFKVYNMDDTIAYEAVRVPKIGTKHCDMNAMRQHARLGGFANSNMFEQMINALVWKVLGQRDTIRLDQVPEGVSVKEGFLTTISIEV